MRTVTVFRDMPILQAANDTPQPMTRAVREMLHALCRITGHPYQPGQSQDLAMAQIERLRNALAQARNG